MMPAPTAPRVTISAHPAGDVSIVDVATGAIERRIRLGGSPTGIARRVPRLFRHGLLTLE